MTREEIQEKAKEYAKKCVALKFHSTDKTLKESDIIAAYLKGVELSKVIIEHACKKFIEDFKKEIEGGQND